MAYGRFDHYRLIDTLRILPKEEEEKGSQEPVLGIEQGGLESAESLLWARYLMYTQLYFHPIRRIYDIHLRDFLKQWLPDGRFSTSVEDHLQMNDNDVTAAILKAAGNPSNSGHEHARRITERTHFRRLYQQNPKDQKRNLKSVQHVFEAAVKEYSDDRVRRDLYPQKTGTGIDFPVLAHEDGRIYSSLELSETLSKAPIFSVDRVFIDPTVREKAKRWLDEKRDDIIPAVPTEG